jgi:hypothetical protein
VRIDENLCILDLLLEAFHTPEGGWTWRGIPDVAAFLSWPLNVILAPCTIAVLLLRLRKPHPPWRRLGRQPGAVGVLLGSMGVTVTALAATVLFGVFATAAGDFQSVFYVSGGIVSSMVAALILGGWIAMALGGAWRRSAGWLDRIGRIVSVTWIVAGIAGGLSSGFFIFILL